MFLVFWGEFSEQPLKLFKTHEHDNIPRSQSYEVWGKPEREKGTSQLNYKNVDIIKHTQLYDNLLFRWFLNLQWGITISMFVSDLTRSAN